MIYIFETELPYNKSIFFALVKIYGLGKSKAVFICKKLGFSKNLKVRELSKEQIQKLLHLNELQNKILGSDLKKTKLLTRKKLLLIKSYKGLRRHNNLPIRGQRTHTNARTARKNIL